MLVGRVGNPNAVWRFVAKAQQKRLLALLFKPVDGEVRYDVRIVAGDLAPLAIDIERGVPVLALALVADPVVEAGALLVVVLAHVPLADVGGLVACVVQRDGEARQVRGVLAKVVHYAVRMGVDSGKEAGPRRRAERSGDERIGAPNALVGQPVEVGSFEGRMAGRRETVPTLVVGEDEDDVRTFGRLLLEFGFAAARQQRRAGDGDRGLEEFASIHRGRLQSRLAGVVLTTKSPEVPDDPCPVI